MAIQPVLGNTHRTQTEEINNKVNLRTWCSDQPLAQDLPETHQDFSQTPPLGKKPGKRKLLLVANFKDIIEHLFGKYVVYLDISELKLTDTVT